MFNVKAYNFELFVRDEDRPKVVTLYKAFCGPCRELWLAQRRARKLWDQLNKLVDTNKPGFTLWNRGLLDKGRFRSYRVEATWAVVCDGGQEFENRPAIAWVFIEED